MPERPIIKTIGIGDVGKRCLERDSSESCGVAHMILDRDASKEMIDEVVSGADMLWIAADAADLNLVAEIARAASGTLTIALLEGPSDPETLSSIEATVDAYAFASSDDDIDDMCAAASAISGLVVTPGNVNVAMDDVKYIFRNAGKIVIAVGEGKDVADAAHAALRGSDLRKDHTVAERVICRIETDPGVGILDIQQALGVISEASDPEAMVLWGHAADADLRGRAKVVIAAGFKPIP